MISRLPYRSRKNRPRVRYAGYTSLRQNVIDPTLLTSLKRRNLSNDILDPTRLTALRRNPRRLLKRSSRRTPFQHYGRSNLPRRRRKLFRKHRKNLPSRLSRLSARSWGSPSRRFRRNPDPDGNPWGPQLYNPLKDRRHKFKNEAHYKKMITRLRRNPW
jgi:hypothetical protein